MQAIVNSLVTAVTNCTNMYIHIKHTTLFVPFEFVAAQIVTTPIVMYGNLIQFNLLVCCPALLNVFFTKL